MLIILSDVNGLYSKDPGVSGAEFIDYVKKITPAIMKNASGKVSDISTGGMYSKLLAAKQAVGHGIPVVIMSGKRKGMLKHLFEGKKVGTYFEPKEVKLTSRKGWIAYGIRSKGKVILDDGAVNALTERGKSLLPSGIVNIEGHFDVGDAINCINSKGRRFAKGLTNYSSTDLMKIKGKNTSEIEKLLGFKYSDEVINRDNLVII
jgi:glutamate 5-kinase